jgi:hypothetical protein
VLSDDLLVVAGKAALAGPRCLDLHPDAAQELELTSRTHPVRVGQRRRLRLEPVALEVPLCGFVALDWGERQSITRVPPAERIALIAAHRTIRRPQGEAASLLDLGGLPAWRLRRPRGWGSLDAAVERLLAVTAAD